MNASIETLVHKSYELGDKILAIRKYQHQIQSFFVDDLKLPHSSEVLAIFASAGLIAFMAFGFYKWKQSGKSIFSSGIIFPSKTYFNLEF